MVLARRVSMGLDFLGGSDGKESACNAEHPGLIPGMGGFPGGGKWQPIPLFLPGNFHGQRSLAGYSPWSLKESDTTDHTHMAYYIISCSTV